MLDPYLSWLSDWRHLAPLAAAIILLYLARDAAQRLLGAVFGFVAQALRLAERWIRAGAQAAMARHDRLAAGLREDELQPRIPDDIRLALRTVDKRGGDSPESRLQVEQLARHVDEHREVLRAYGVQLEAIQHGSGAQPLRLGHSSGIRLVFALVLVAAVGIAGWLNFALLERPMAEVVGDSHRVMGVPLYRLAALAIIVLEVAVGMVLLEALGGTTMFPQFERLEQKKKLRIAIVVTMAAALIVLAVIEAALALTRDGISRLERELMGTLAGAQPTEGAQAVGEIARYAQAAFGFVIPFALAFLGFAIEMLVRNARVVVQLAMAVVLQVAAFFARLLRHLVLSLLAVMLALYDFIIFLPLLIERKWREARS
ncbi:hypothetical protein BH11PSE3_BH11PSE3_40790 [soil metagenome]